MVGTSSDVGDGPLDFDEFFLREHPKMVAIALAMTGDTDTARDIAQDALVSAYRTWDRVSGLERPGAWLRRVTINSTISWQRRRRSERRAVARLTVTPVDPPPEPDDGFWKAVRALPRRQRAATVLYYVEDRSISDIAEILEIADGTVKATLAKARRNLARSLGLDRTGGEDMEEGAS